MELFAHPFELFCVTLFAVILATMLLCLWLGPRVHDLCILCGCVAGAALLLLPMLAWKRYPGLGAVNAVLVAGPFLLELLGVLAIYHHRIQGQPVLPGGAEAGPQEAPRAGMSHLWLWTLFIIFFVYPLSIGPAARLHQACPGARPALEAVYAPLIALASNSATLSKALEWYIANVWRTR